MNKLRNKALLLAMPFILGFVVFYIIPYVSVFYYSFKSQTTPTAFVLFDNFIDVLQNEYYLLALKNTCIFTLISIPLLLILSYVLANVIYNQKNIYMVLLFVPVLIPSASIAVIWNDIFNTTSAISFYIMFIWKNIGLITLIITGGLTRIPSEVYDAAAIDGANTLDKHKNIVLPYLSPVLFFCFLVGLMQSFKIFREVYLTYTAYPPQELYMIGHYIFNKFGKLDYTELSIGTLIFSAAIIILLIVLCLLGKRIFFGGRKR